MSSDRLAHHQNSMGLVFHTATFNKDMLETAVNALQQDKSWTKRCEELRRPKEAKKIGKIVTHDVPSDHWAAKNRVFDDKDLATHANSKDTLAKKLPAELREKFVRGQEVCPLPCAVRPARFYPRSIVARGGVQADQLGRVSEALAAYTECVAVCDAALAAKSSKPISQAKKHCQGRISHMQAQTKRKILVRVV